MTTKTKCLILVGVLLAGVAIGRFTLPAKIVTKTEIKEVQVKQSETDRQKQDHSIITVTETKAKDGTVVKVTKTQNNVETETQQQSKTVDSKDSKTDKEVTYNTDKWSLSALAVTRPFSDSKQIVYGGEATYRLIGPFTVGGIGLSDGTIGVSVGIRF